jgi:hypothetical protein
MKNQTTTVNQLKFEQHIKNCVFCNDPLPPHSHGGRKFCPFKHGYNDYCKYQYKKIMEQMRLVGETPILSVHDTVVEKPPKLIEGGELLQKEIPKESVSGGKNGNNENKNLVEKLRIVRLISSTLEERKEMEIGLDEFVKMGYNPSIYDERKAIPNSNLFYTEIDDFAIFWTQKNKLLLTHLSEILWLQRTT